MKPYLNDSAFFGTCPFTETPPGRSLTRNPKPRLNTAQVERKLMLLPLLMGSLAGSPRIKFVSGLGFRV